MHSIVLGIAFLAATGSPPYTPSAGKNAPAEAYDVTLDKSGRAQLQRTEQPVQRDTHGNARGNQYDLAIDGAFEGQTVLILDQVGNTLENTKAALKQKGLATVAYRNGTTPSPAELKAALAKSCQLWLISAGNPLLSDDHIKIIKAFFDEGHGVYIWGDNDPLYADANRVASALVPGLRMEGDHHGDIVVGIAGQKRIGVREGHLITTGLEHLYEGITIATIQFKPGQGKNPSLYSNGPQSADRSPELPRGFTPLLHGSAGNLVSVAYP